MTGRPPHCFTEPEVEVAPQAVRKPGGENEGSVAGVFTRTGRRRVRL
jgi:hypothetical protein